MGRKSRAQKIIEEHRDFKDKHPDSKHLIIYDFAEGNNPRQFYDNIHRLFDHYGGCLVQRSVAEVMGSKACKSVSSLAEFYGASVLRYRVNEE